MGCHWLRACKRVCRRGTNAGKVRQEIRGHAIEGLEATCEFGFYPKGRGKLQKDLGCMRMG